MKREILINGTARETRVAILEDDRLAELLLDDPDSQRTVGNIYLGKVEAVLPGMQAAFVNIGEGKSAFLHASDLVEPDDDEDEEGNGQRAARRLPNIQDHLQRGQSLLVQVTKEPIGTKGPRVTAQISLAGRFLVYLPRGSKVGVSRKIASREERARLRGIAVTSAKRTAVLPDTPTVIESGLAGFEVSNWYAVAAPAATAPAIIKRLNAEILTVLTVPELKKRFFELAADPFGSR